VHDRAAKYFKALPEPEKIVSLEDLSPVIELYHHLVKAGKFDEARDLYKDRLSSPIYFQLSIYHLEIELLSELFPGGDAELGGLPQLKKESAQASTLNDLASAYALSGQPGKAVPLLLLAFRFPEKNDEKKNLAIGLGNAAQLQLVIGQLSAACGHLRKRIAICREIKDEFKEAVGHQELGRALAFQGSKEAEEELSKAFEINNKRNDYQSMSLIAAYRSLWALLQGRIAAVQQGKVKQSAGFAREALRQARQALKYAEEDARTDCPTPRDFVRAYWMLGEALIQCMTVPQDVETEPLSIDIPFYDEYFQQIMETLPVSTGVEFTAAERCLHEALRRCRKTNMVEFEPDTLLGLVRLGFAKNGTVDETLVQEAREIAMRAGYRTVMADIHLFCGQAMLELKKTAKSPKTLLGFTVSLHLEKAKEYAVDVSDISNFYQPVKSKADEFYRGIPEYQMLKRGMTEEERIKNGYFVAYRIAEAIENG